MWRWWNKDCKLRTAKQQKPQTDTDRHKQTQRLREKHREMQRLCDEMEFWERDEWVSKCVWKWIDEWGGWVSAFVRACVRAGHWSWDGAGWWSQGVSVVVPNFPAHDRYLKFSSARFMNECARHWKGWIIDSQFRGERFKQWWWSRKLQIWRRVVVGSRLVVVVVEGRYPHLPTHTHKHTCSRPFISSLAPHSLSSHLLGSLSYPRFQPGLPHPDFALFSRLYKTCSLLLSSLGGWTFLALFPLACASGFWSHVCAAAKCVVICLCASTRVTSSSCPVAVICFFLKGYEPP
jgi:hypothetical protein